MIYFALNESGRFTLEDYLGGEWGRPLAGRITQVTYDDLLRTRRMPRGAWIFSALDVVSASVRRLAECCRNAACEAGLPVLNHPLQSLRRYDLLALLHREGINDFRAIYADERLDGLRYPVFLRQAEQHTGNDTGLLACRADLDRELAASWFRRKDPRSRLIVEFCDTVSPDGLYRKYSVYRVGDHYVPRHLHADHSWMVKSSGKATEDRLAIEELAFVRENPHGDWIRKVFELARIEYGRLDYGIVNGRPQAWEINLTPTLARPRARVEESPERKRYRALLHPSKEFSHAALRRAFEAIDPGPLTGPDIEVSVPSELAASVLSGQARERRLKRRRDFLLTVAQNPLVQAVKPALDRTAARIHAWTH